MKIETKIKQAIPLLAELQSLLAEIELDLCKKLDSIEESKNQRNPMYRR